MSNGKANFANFPELSAASRAVTLRIMIRDMRPNGGAGVTTELGKVWQRVQSLFNEVCASGFNKSGFTNCQAYWAFSPVEKAELKDIVVYLVPSLGQSLIRRHHPNAFAQATQGLGGNVLLGGLTTVQGVANDPVALSEVYDDSPLNEEPEWLANTIFHECYHNKLAKGDEVHSMGSGFVGSVGGFLQHRLVLDKKLPLTSSDKEVMSQAIGLDRRQRVKL